jgi:hypothetical protein
MAMEITPETSRILNIPKIMDSFQNNINKITSGEGTAIAQSVCRPLLACHEEDLPHK